MKPHIPSLYGTQEKAVKRVNELRKQVGRPPLVIGDKDVVPIESLWTEIEDLEAQVERKSAPKPKAPPEPSKRAAQPAIEPSTQHVDTTTKVVEESAR